MLTDIVSTDYIDQVTSYIEEKSRYQPTISEMLLIQQQTDLIMELAMNKNTRKSTRLSTQISDMSFEIPQTNLNGTINMSFSCIDLKKQLSVTKDQQGRTLGEALAQIRKHCSRNTFQFVKDKLGSRDAFRKEKKIMKEKQFNEELSKRCLRLTEQVAQYESKIKSLEEKIESLTDNKRKIAQSQMIALSKQQQLIKMEKSILYKEKILAGARKKLTAQTQLLEEEKKINQNLKLELQNLLMELDQKQLMGKCKGKCWQSEIFDKCKQNLNTQRRLLERQQQQIQKHYLQVKQIADRMKREMR